MITGRVGRGRVGLGVGEEAGVVLVVGFVIGAVGAGGSEFEIGVIRIRRRGGVGRRVRVRRDVGLLVGEVVVEFRGGSAVRFL